VIWYFQPSNFASQLEKVGVGGALGWLFLTLGARLCLVETIVLPIRALGFSFQRSDAFWLGWVRTFANQIVPLSGLAIYTREIRRKADIPWSGIVALSTPTFLLATAALSVIGLCAIVSNVSYVGASTLPMLIAFTAIGGGSLFAATHAAWMIDRLPVATFLFAEQSAAAFRRLSERSRLIATLILLHALAILVRGTRIWLLFLLVGAEMTLPAALLVIAIAESAALFQITPGGLGLREGAIIGGAVLLHISPELGATVALIDRLFIVAITTLLAIPGYVLVRR
jgi:uncharacterized membrane protein YbhN (UPF0104 family)